MKKIEDYYDQDVGIICTTPEEWEIACELTKHESEHPASGKFTKGVENVIGIYKSAHGWINWANAGVLKIRFPLSDFLETNLNYEIY